ncbi:hypothetical protein ACWF9G_27455 [Nocardia sp. NPDC055029]
MIRKLTVLIAVAAGIASAAYVFIYLYRWEWSRAIMSATLFVAAETALIGLLVTSRLREIQLRLNHTPEPTRQLPARIVTDAEPAQRVGFAWLVRPDRLNVFVPVLLAGGVALTGVAWVVERVAQLTTKPIAVQQITRRLDRLSLPPNGFLAPYGDTQLLRGPSVGYRR